MSTQLSYKFEAWFAKLVPLTFKLVVASEKNVKFSFEKAMNENLTRGTGEDLNEEAQVWKTKIK